MWDDAHVSDVEMLPAELEAVHQRLAQDGAAWREQLPSSEALATRVTAIVERTPRAPDRGSAQTTPTETRELDVRPVSPGPATQPRDGWRRTRGLVGVAAAVVIVGLIGTVLSEVNVGRSGKHPLAQATVTPTMSSLHVPGQWERVMELPRGQYALIAPSDPRVIYVMDYPHIRRTDNDGRTWHELPTPAGGTLGSAYGDHFIAMVSPVDPYTVFLVANVYRSGPDGEQCTTADAAQKRESALPGPRVASLLDSSTWCDLNYYTTDGGQHWHPANLPMGWTSLGIPGNGFFMPLQAQGGRLYDMISPPDQGPQASPNLAWRLVTSADGGVTWQLADVAINAGGGAVLTYLAAPSGQAVFAQVVEHDRSLDVWRSDDAGVHWTKVPPARSAQFPRALLAAAVDSNGQPLLYAEGAVMPPHPGIDAHPTFTLWVSADGGSSWTAASSRGLPDSSWSDGTYISGVTADGSVVVPFRSATSSDVTFYAWKLGQTTWRQVCPQMPDGAASVFPAGPWGSEALWGMSVVRDSQYVPTFTVWRCSLG